MKKFIYFFLFFLVSLAANSQTQPSGIPSPRSDSGFAQYNWVRALKGGFIFPQRDTLFTPTYIGTVVYWANAGSDSSLWIYRQTTGRKWGKVVTLSGGVSTGTVTSIATNAATGITGGTITTSGTLALDTTLVSTRLWRQKGIDSVQYNLTSGLLLKVNISDTALMLNPYLRKIDTAAMLSNYVPISRTITTNAPLFGGGSLAANRTFGVDTGRANAQLVTGGSLTAVKDTLIDLIASSGGGTVLDVSTTDGFGIISSVATSTSTPDISIRVDTFAISTRAWRNKGVDSAISVIPLRITDSLAAVNRIKAGTSGGGIVQTNTGAISFSWGGGGSQEVDFHGFAGYDANRSSSYTTRSFTDKGYVDSSLALRLLVGDTAAMLSNYRRTTTKIQNSDLANSTISGVSLGSNLATLTFGDYLQVGASSYNGSAATTITTNGTSTNSGSTLVARDVNGDFSARNISATLLGNASSASTVAITNDVTTNATYYPMFSTVTTGSTSTRVSSSKLTYNPSTGMLSSTGFTGALTGNASTATVLQTARTINGVAFDGSANITISAAVGNSLTAGYGITGSPFDGSLARTWIIDTSNISTKANVTGALVAKLNIYDTAAMLAPFIQYSDTTGLFDKVVRTFGTQTIGGTKTFSGILNASSDLIFRGGNNNKIEWDSEDGVIYTNGGSFLTLGAAGNASNMVFDRLNARWGVGTIPTATFDVNGTMKATTIVKAGGTSSQILLADGSTIPTSSYGTGTVTSVATSAPITGGTITSTGTIGITQSTTSTDGYLSSTDWNTFNNKASTASVALKLNISDTAAMLSNYRRSTTLIENADLRNSAITINGSSTALGGSISVGTVTSVAASAGTGISVTGSPITSSGTLTITNTAPDQTVTLTAGSGISVTGTYPNFTVTNSSPSSGGTVTSVSAGTGMSFTTITSTGAVNADTTTLATRAYVVGLDVGKANTSLNNVNGVLSSTYGGAGSVSGILKANGSGVVSAAVAGDITSLISGTYLPLSGGTLTGALSGTSLSMSGNGTFANIFTGNGNYLSLSGSGSTFTRIYRASGLVLESNGFTATLSDAGVFSGTSLSMSGNIQLGDANNLTWGGAYGANIPTIIGVSGASGYLTFYPSGSTNGEAARITNNGTFLINTTTTDGVNKLIVNGGITATRLKSTTSQTAAELNGGFYGNSGGDYHTLGYNVGFTGTGGTWNYVYNDFASFIRFQAGGLQLWTAPSGSGAMSPTNVFSVAQSGAATFSSSLNGTSLSMSGGGSFLGSLGVGTASPYEAFTIQGAASRMDLNNAGGSSRKSLLIEPLGYGGNAYARIESYDYGGSAGGQLAINTLGGAVTINTTTTDGTNKLIVNGGVKGTTGKFGGAGNNATLEVAASSGEVFRADASGGAFRIIADQTGVSTQGTFSHTGAATFSSSVTATNLNLSGRGTSFIYGMPDWRIYNTSGNGLVFNNYSVDALVFSSTGVATFVSSVTANSFIKSGGTSTQFLKADGSVDGNTYITSASVGDGTLTLAVSGSGLSGSQTFTANQSSNATFTVTSNATTAATASTIAYRDGSGNLNAVGFFETSDKRKKDIFSVTKQEDGIDFVGFKWKKELNLDNKKHLGVIAQQVEKVLPDAVNTDEKGDKSVNYTEVLLFKLENLTKKVEELEQKLERYSKKAKTKN